MDRALAGTVLVRRARVVVDRQVAQDQAFLGVLEHLAAARVDKRQLTRPEASAADRLGRRERHGPRLEATATNALAVTAKEAGRRPFRSTIAPTRRPSANTSAAGPSHGARNPAVRRRNVATWGCGAPEGGERFGDRGQERLRKVPAGAGEGSRPSSSDSRSEPSGDSSGPASISSAAIGFAPRSRSAPGPAPGCRGRC